MAPQLHLPEGHRESLNCWLTSRTDVDRYKRSSCRIGMLVQKQSRRGGRTRTTKASVIQYHAPWWGPDKIAYVNSTSPLQFSTSEVLERPCGYSIPIPNSLFGVSSKVNLFVQRYHPDNYVLWDCMKCPHVGDLYLDIDRLNVFAASDSKG